MDLCKKVVMVVVLLSLVAGCGAKRDVRGPIPDPKSGTADLPVKRDLIVLLPDPDGRVGMVQVSTKKGSEILTNPKHATEVEGIEKAPTVPRLLAEEEIMTLFGSALSSQPDLETRFVSFVLYFERDTTHLTPESRKFLSEVVRTIRKRTPSEVYLMGHTDRVGAEDYNMGLSARRAERIRDLLVLTGVKPSTMLISFYGESRPLIPTEDEVPEPRNRRVEVVVR